MFAKFTRVSSRAYRTTGSPEKTGGIRAGDWVIPVTAPWRPPRITLARPQSRATSERQGDRTRSIIRLAFTSNSADGHLAEMNSVEPRPALATILQKCRLQSPRPKTNKRHLRCAPTMSITFSLSFTWASEISTMSRGWLAVSTRDRSAGRISVVPRLAAQCPTTNSSAFSTFSSLASTAPETNSRECDVPKNAMLNAPVVFFSNAFMSLTISVRQLDIDWDRSTR
mmetsp:Transcript_60642/g.162707  ORF Transcript_60642/g.162707 Transcript_60642/m.162707 type:complete len:226 (+) Transcript_60642:333-1010(+)